MSKVDIDIFKCFNKRVLYRFKDSSDSSNSSKQRIRMGLINSFSLNKICVKLEQRWYLIDDVEVFDLLENKDVNTKKENPLRGRAVNSQTDYVLSEDEADEEEMISVESERLTSIKGTNHPVEQYKNIELNENHLGKRFLYVEKHRTKIIFQGYVEEFSKTLNFVRSNGSWLNLNEYIVIDILKDKRHIPRMKFINEDKE